MYWKLWLVVIIQLGAWIVTGSALESSVLAAHLFSLVTLIELLEYKRNVSSNAKGCELNGENN